jgi:hypothetical protein
VLAATAACLVLGPASPAWAGDRDARASDRDARGGGWTHARAEFSSIAGRPDRLQHASLAFAIGLGAGIITRREGAALGVGLGLGVVKEVLDRNGTGFDPGDLAADAVGVGLATLVVTALER